VYIIEDKDLGNIWAAHFPKRKECEASRRVIVALIEVIKKRAVADALKRCGITEAQFLEAEND
jgi:hypothetical protein